MLIICLVRSKVLAQVNLMLFRSVASIKIHSLFMYLNEFSVDVISLPININWNKI